MLRGQVGVVTAGTKGIGLAVVSRLLREGAKVVMCSRNQQNVDSARITLEEQLQKQQKQEGSSVSENLLGIVGNVNSGEDRQRLREATLSRFGRVDMLVSNAASNPYFGPILSTPPAAWEKTMLTNVTSAMELAREFVPHIAANEPGSSSRSLVFVASIAAYTHLQGLGTYCVSKSALVSLSKMLAMELAPIGVRCNSVCPGVIKTDFSKALWDDPKMSKASLAAVPAKRFGESEEIAGAVAFLLSKDAQYMTGESMVISGGMQGWR